MTAGDSLECRYLGWGRFNKLRQMPLTDNEVLIYTSPIGNVQVLLHGFLNCIRSEEIKKRFPEQFSENDLAGVTVAMVKNMPDGLLPEFHAGVTVAMIRALSDGLLPEFHAGVTVAMSTTLSDSLLPFNEWEWFDSAERSSSDTKLVVGAVIGW